MEINFLSVNMDNNYNDIEVLYSKMPNANNKIVIYCDSILIYDNSDIINGSYKTKDKNLIYLIERIITLYNDKNFIDPLAEMKLTYDYTNGYIYTNDIQLDVTTDDDDVMIIYYIYSYADKVLNNLKNIKYDIGYEVYQESNENPSFILKNPITQESINRTSFQSSKLPFIRAIMRIKNLKHDDQVGMWMYNSNNRLSKKQLGGLMSKIRIGNKTMQLYVKENGGFVTIKRAVQLQRILKRKQR